MSTPAHDNGAYDKPKQVGSPDKPKPPITCQKCGYVYREGACPECWYADAKWGR